MLCRMEPMASQFIYLGLGFALVDAGHKFIPWNPERFDPIPTIDEVKPDILLAQGYNLDRATIKAINSHPDMEVLLKVGHWGMDIDTSKYAVLMASEDEKRLVGSIENKDRLTVFNYCHPNRVNSVIGGWLDIVGNIHGLLPAADAHSYFPVPQDERLQSDVTFIGGYWGYKGQNINKYIIPICNPVGQYNVKIFGNQSWPVPQYMGAISDSLCKTVLCSATICPNIHEPHSNTYGFDVTPRCFNIMACKAFCISDYVESLYADCLGEDELVCFRNQEEFMDHIQHFTKHTEDRIPYIQRGYKRVMQDHTYANRVDLILKVLGQ